MKKKALFCSVILLSTCLLGAPASLAAGETASSSETDSSNILNSNDLNETTESSTAIEDTFSMTSESLVDETTESTSEPATADAQTSPFGDQRSDESAHKYTQEDALQIEPPMEEPVLEPQGRAALTRSSGVPMYRMYNPGNGEHFYTASAEERDGLMKIGWGNYEGIGWYAPTSGDKVYRLYNKGLRDHHYTKSWDEVSWLTKNYGWTYEGVSWLSAPKNNKPVYRLFHPYMKTGSHHYTMSWDEVSWLTKSHGWKYEGIGWYAADAGGEGNKDNNFAYLNVTNYNQYALGAPSGCEGAALLQALQYKGKATNYDLRGFLNTIPKSPNGNPNNGFVGSPFVENSWTYSAIYPAPLASWGSRFGNVANISGSSVDALLNEVKNGNPVVAYVTIGFQPVRWGNWSFGSAANNNHAVTLAGFNRSANQVYVSDPIHGRYWLSLSTFSSIYNARKYAVVVR